MHACMKLGGSCDIRGWVCRCRCMGTPAVARGSSHGYQPVAHILSMALGCASLQKSNCLLFGGQR